MLIGGVREAIRSHTTAAVGVRGIESSGDASLAGRRTRSTTESVNTVTVQRRVPTVAWRATMVERQDLGATVDLDYPGTLRGGEPNCTNPENGVGELLGRTDSNHLPFVANHRPGPGESHEPANPRTTIRRHESHPVGLACAIAGFDETRTARSRGLRTTPGMS